MIEESTNIRVRYAETDQMGFVYYGNYAQYLEIGRVAAMKKAGISYRKLEEEGVSMPVRDMHIKYFKAAKYDDELTIKCWVEDMPTNKMTFYYAIYREEELLAEAETTLFFMDSKKGRACRPPEPFLTYMKDFFN